MTPEQRAVQEFHQTTGATIGSTPKIRDARLRAELILEEAKEFIEAVGLELWGDFYDGVEIGSLGQRISLSWFGRTEPEPDLLKAIDALCDLLYVVYGAAVTFGVDLESFFREVHRSNMTKVGGPVREDGKQLKPKGYEPPNLKPILTAQEQLAELDKRIEAANEIGDDKLVDALIHEWAVIDWNMRK